MIYHIEIAGKGGITQYTYNLVQALNESGPNRSAAIVGAKKYELIDAPRNFELIQLFNRFKTNPIRLIRFFLNHVQETDIVHFQLSSYPIVILNIIRLIQRVKKTKIVVTAHNVVSHETFPVTRNALLKIYRKTDRIIVHAKQNKTDLNSQFNITPEKIAVIPHGNYEFVNPTKKEQFRSKDDPNFNLLFFGFIRAYKGLDILLEALKIVVEKHQNIRLQIAGKPKESFQKYQQMIDLMGLSEYINLHLDYVAVPQMESFFENTDIVMLPYKRISQSGIIFLAYAFGKPVIASSVGGLPEVVDDGQSGLLVPAEDAEALAKAILQLASDPQKVQQMARYAQQLSQDKFSWQSIARKTSDLYTNL